MKLLKIYLLLRLCLIVLVLGLYATLAHLLIEAASADPLSGLVKINEAQNSKPTTIQATQTVAKLTPQAEAQ